VGVVEESVAELNAMVKQNFEGQESDSKIDDLEEMVTERMSQ
jgi:hypothetical protein